jgi:hypothetical protein
VPPFPLLLPITAQWIATRGWDELAAILNDEPRVEKLELVEVDFGGPEVTVTPLAT